MGKHRTPKERIKTCLACHSFYDAIKKTQIYCSIKCCPSRRSGENSAFWKGEDAKYNAVHKHNLRHWDKLGLCMWCSRNTKTDWANLTGNYSRQDKNDWAELCRSCHLKYDRSNPKMMRLIPKSLTAQAQ